MEALYLAAAGIYCPEDRGDLSSEEYEDLERVDITDIDIAGDSEQYRYGL